MSIPASALQQAQIGLETTAGTAVPANRRLQATSISVKPDIVGRETFTALGSLVPTTIVPGVELSSASVEGTLSFRDLAYLFTAFLGSVTPTQIQDGETATGAYQYSWTPGSFSATTPKTLTVETGYPGGQVFRAAGVSLTRLAITIEPQRVAVSGEGMGRQLETVASFTASPTDIAAVLPDYTLSLVKIADTYADLDTATPLSRAFRGELDFGERYSRVLPLGLQDVLTVPAAHQPRWNLTVALDATGIAQIQKLRANQTVYVAVTLQGPVIYTGGITVRHELTVKLACTYLEWSMEDAEGVGVTPLTGALVHDPAIGGAYTVTLVTDIGTL